MTREMYTLLLPVLVFGLVALGFILGLVFPHLTSTFYLVYALAAVLVIFTTDRLARTKVKGVLTDERIDGIAGKSALISFRASIIVITATAMVMTYAFPATEAARLVAVGGTIAIGTQGLIYSIAFLAIRRKA